MPECFIDTFTTRSILEVVLDHSRTAMTNNLVIDNQSMATLLNKYFSLISNTTSVNDSIKTNSINTNDATSSASIVGRQDATTKLCDNTNVNVDNNNEICYVLHQQSCICDNIISSHHTLPNFEIYTEDVLIQLSI